MTGAERLHGSAAARVCNAVTPPAEAPMTMIVERAMMTCRLRMVVGP